MVYVFEHCPCIYESSYGIVSIHSTKRGAYKAMLKKRRQIWDWETSLGSPPEQIFFLERFRVKEYEVET
jgi:hypothetical protein